MSIRKPRDGRRLRAERSRLAVAEAVLDLLEEGVTVPTVADIADRAGVSLRSVHHHFSDREELFIAAARLQNQRTMHLIEPIPPDGSFVQRLAEFVKQRARLLEAVRPVRRAAIPMSTLSGAVKLHLDSFRKIKRDQLVQLFAPELDGHTPARRKQLVAAACCAASWSAWEELRANQGLSIAAARRVMKATLETLLLRWEES
jgi:AcrR family transcriptional regulator